MLELPGLQETHAHYLVEVVVLDSQTKLFTPLGEAESYRSFPDGKRDSSERVKFLYELQ